MLSCYIIHFSKDESRQVMIRLIAADMDGTLLNGRKQLPEDMFRVIRDLQRRGICFVAASGRQYYNLYHKFSGEADRLYYFSENGALVFHGTENLFYSELPRDGIMHILARVGELPGAFPVLCGLGCAYHLDRDPEFIRNTKLYYDRLEAVSDFRPCMETDHICKTAVFAPNAEATVYPALKRQLEPEFSVVLSGSTWVDIMNPGISKGTALAFLQKRLGIAAEECMTFGDYLNDSSMIRDCPNSYAMANAHPDLKRLAAHVTEYDNEHNGVLRIICRELRLPPPEHMETV